VFSVNVDGFQSPSALAEVLEADFGLLTRSGMHCAPLAHQTIGTHPAGTCRLSFGPFTTEAHVRRAAEALATVAQQAPGPQTKTDYRRDTEAQRK
jgi:selenocysteine lyase/cysteine desulfurase